MTKGKHSVWLKTYKTGKTLQFAKNSSRYVRVRAYVVEDGKRVCSEWTRVKKATVKR